MSTSTAAPPATTPKKRIVRRKKKQLTPKQKLVKESAEQRFKIEKLVFVWQEKLFSQPKITAQILQSASIYLQPKTYEEIIEERVVQEWCGYPLCAETPKANEIQKYKISLSRRKVFDQTELANYCSEDCFKKSKYYSMQLSEEPVWFRDLNTISNTHVISKDQDFLTAIQQQKKGNQSQKTSQELRQEYVKELLDKVPKDTEDTFQIIEKSTESPAEQPTIQTGGVFDSIEGYRIEIKTDGKRPTTMVLKKKKEEEKKEEPVPEPQQDPDDPEALFETMMMLKEMNMDQEVPKEIVKEEKKPAKKQVQFDIPKEETLKETPKQPIKAESGSTISKNVVEKDTNVINVTTQKPKKVAKKKKKNVPELSLFGTIWTMLDHMTTKATRVYLNELENNKQRVDITSLTAENGLMDETMYLRGQIFSERILDTYGIIRAQLDIKANLEDDIVNVIKTFKLSDASMIALNPAQCYMMALVLLKSLGDILLQESDWKNQFDECCKSVNQSIDMVDACVRVLKVASF